MKVLHVYRTYFPDTQGGLEETIRQICRNSKPLGVVSRVLSLTPEDSASIVHFDEAEVHRFPLNLDISSCGISMKALKGFRLLAEWADIVHYHYPWPFGDILHFSGRVSKPVVVTYHSDIIRQRLLRVIYEPLKRWFLAKADRIVATSENYLSTSSTLVHYSGKVEVIPIGLDEESYPAINQSQIDRLREKAGQDYFLFIGVLRNYKGLHILLDAIHGTSLNVVIAGSGPAEDSLKRRVKQQLGNVRLLGQVSDEEKVALLKSCRAFVLPSNMRSEAFGVSLVEAAMFGKPLISTEIGTGTSYVNRHEESGLVVPPNDINQLREAMQVLNNDKSLAEQLGRGARKRYEALFTGKNMGQKYADLYKRIAGGA